MTKFYLIRIDGSTKDKLDIMRTKGVKRMSYNSVFKFLLNKSSKDKEIEELLQKLKHLL